MSTSTPSTDPRPVHTPALADVIAAYRTCEFATVSRSGTPIAWPIVSWQRPDGALVLTTSIALPQKAYNIRRNPLVAMLFSDPTASGMVDPPQILVQGTASCPDEIVTDVSDLPEYWTRLMVRQPSSKSMSSFLGRHLMGFYYLRLVVTVQPSAVASRPAVSARTPLTAPILTKEQRLTPFGQAAGRLPGYRSGVLAAFDNAGHPILQRVRPAADNAVFVMDLPDGVQVQPGPASVLFHRHDDQLDSQDSFVVAGDLQQRDGRWTLAAERFIPGPAGGGPLALIRTVRGLNSTAKRYLARRGRPRPAIEWAAIDELWRQAGSTG